MRLTNYAREDLSRLDCWEQGLIYVVLYFLNIVYYYYYYYLLVVVIVIVIVIVIVVINNYCFVYLKWADIYQSICSSYYILFYIVILCILKICLN